jgi:signal peptidase I
MKSRYESQKGRVSRQAGFALGKFLLEFIQSIVLALAVFVLFYLFVAQPNEVKGSSMYPTFKDKEYLLTEKISYELGDPKRGDVVIFKAPASEPCSADECEYIKRVIGIPGDKVMVKEGDVYVNGEMLDQSFLPEKVYTSEGEYMEEGVEKEIPENQYLCFGDNRPNSRDGREFGPIERSLIIGKAFFRYWPLNVVGLIPKVNF